ncbi:FUSC family protein [Leifsonia sp. NPDC080035]|uniref:FUSC family protein n=1 Tax=Leifsonia sp. NPDC080035 TaxID=3143936 RepID=A0AAU7GJC2_9MICO
MKHLGSPIVALVMTAAAAGACATTWYVAQAFGAGGSPAVLATVVALSVGRRDFAGRAEFARAALVLPLTSVAAAVVGWLLVTVPIVGALVFIGGMSVPIWMRRFGQRIAHLGALAALPLTAMLVVPVSGMPWWLGGMLALIAGVVAVLWVALAREVLALARLRGSTAEPGTSPPSRATPSPAAAPAPATSRAPRRLPASTRMAVQMAVALAAAFVVGWGLFPEHAMWVVLTAFIVNAGNRGRGDVLHRSALRVVGAVAGSLAAVLLALAVPRISGLPAVAVIFAALFVGGWLRAVSYAYWSFAVTLVVSLLQELFGTAPFAGEAGMLIERVAAIVVGGVLGVAAAWLVLPVRSTDVLRKRLSDMLITLGAVFSPAEPAERAARLDAFHAAVDRVEELAPAHRARRMLGGHRAQPIDCITAAAALPAIVRARIAAGPTPPQLRAAVGDARRALAAPVDLERVRTSLLALATMLGPDSAR